MGLILDTSIIVAAERRSQALPQILEQIRAAYGEDDFGLSIVTIAELVHGAYRAKTDADRLRRLSFVDELSEVMPVYTLTLQIARGIGRIQAQQAMKGIAIAFEDLAIGGTALELGFAIATLNLRHFEMIPGLKIALH